MHICIISAFAITEKDNLGGVHTHTEMLSNILTKMGNKVTFITAGDQNESHEKTINGIRVIFTPGSKTEVVDKEWIRNLCNTFNELQKKDPVDCIFSEGYYAYGLQGHHIFSKVPIVTFVHNFHLTQFYKNFSEVRSIRSLASYVFKTVPRLVFRMLKFEIPFFQSSHFVISVSELNAKYLQNVYMIPKHKLSVIHNWVNVDEFSPNYSYKSEYRRRFHLSKDTIVFLLVGALWRPKGFHVAIKSFIKFVERFPDALLMIAGTGVDEESLRKLVAENNLITDRVRFLGLWKHSELPYLYNLADIFLIPSIHPEGHAYTLIEAMSCGLPSIATKLGGNIETIGDAGILVPPRDEDAMLKSMIELAQDARKREYLSHNARERVLEYFSEKIASEKFLSLLAKIPPEKRH